MSSLERPDIDITGCVAATDRLLQTLAAVADDDVRRPSLLPGWTIGHVLTHLARNADSVVRMMQAAARGEVAWQYAEGQREREIEEGATRPASVLVDDVTSTAADVSRVWAATADDVWATGRARVRTGECPVALIPLRRWREVELHHADLGLGFSYDDLSPAYVEREVSGVSPPAFGGRDPKGG